MERVIITRKVDELERIVIPKEMREKLKIKHGQKLNISVKNHNIVLSIETEQEDGITMRIDELGRILIPYQIREKMGIVAKQEWNTFIKGKKIILQRNINSLA